MQFTGFPKLARLNREMVITEKLDGTNASIFIQNESLEEHKNQPRVIALSPCGNFTMRVGSRTRWIIPKDDNYAFAQWCQLNADELFKLGEGHHFGEWWGSGIQRGYNLPKGEKRFSLFNTGRWSKEFDEIGKQLPPKCCDIVPVLAVGLFDTDIIKYYLNDLIEHGSYAAPGFNNPEGIVVFHTAATQSFKVTIKDDESPKSLVK